MRLPAGFRRRIRANGGGALAGIIFQPPRSFIFLAEGGNLLGNSVFVNLKVPGGEAGNVISFLIGHRHIQLHHIDGDTKDGVGLVLLGRHPNFGAGENPQAQNADPKDSLCHKSSSLHPPDQLQSGEGALVLGEDSSLPSRNSFPVSRRARNRAGQSSKWVAKIFSTMRCVSAGTN